jgi:hypothetical protein
MNIFPYWRHTAYTLTLLQALLLGGCSKPPAEEAIARAIGEMAEALEERKVSPITERLHEDLQIHDSAHGTLGSEQARRMLTAIFMRHRNINVVITNIQVTLDNVRDDRASARFNALVTGGSGGILPDRAELFRIDSQWHYDGDWKLLHVEARRALE